MLKQIVRILLILVTAFVFTHSLSAQSQKTQESTESRDEFKGQWEKIFSSANATAMFNDGKVGFIKIPVPNEGEKFFTFEHSKDEKSFILTDEKGLKLQIFLGKDKRIQSIIMPDGKRAVFNWKQVSNGIWVNESIKFEGNTMLRVCLVKESSACRDAAVASAIALGVCAATGGLSVPCLAATANAAYQTYKCYESTQPELAVLTKAFINPNDKIMLKESTESYLVERKHLKNQLVLE